MGGKRRRRTKSNRAKRANRRKTKTGRSKRRKGRGRKTQARRGRRLRFHRGSVSKTHSGKDFETRKSSKRYNEKKWSKYLWHGRHTLPAPDFPFVGGRKKRQRGGQGQPYSNEPISFIQSIPGTSLGPNESALANPPPYRAEYNCELNNFPHQE